MYFSSHFRFLFYSLTFRDDIPICGYITLFAITRYGANYNGTAARRTVSPLVSRFSFSFYPCLSRRASQCRLTHTVPSVVYTSDRCDTY